MGKIVGFVLATIGLSAIILVPTAIWWKTMISNLEEVSLIVPATTQYQFWQGFAILAFVVIVSVATLMALIIFWDGEKRVLR